MKLKKEFKRDRKIGLLVAANAPVPDVLGGGAERLVTMLINENEKQCNVELVVFSVYSKEAIKQTAKYQNTSFFFFRTGTILDKCYNLLIRLANKIFPQLKILKHGYYRNISKIIRNQDLDFVIDENGYVPELFYIEKAVGKEKLAAHIHWDVDPVEASVDGLYGSIIGVSNYIANSWKQRSNDSSLIEKTVYSAVDEARFSIKLEESSKRKLRKKWGIAENDLVFIYCGRIAEQKGVKELVQAFMKIHHSGIKLLIVGGENLKYQKKSDFFEELTNSNAKNVIFTGYVDNNLLYQFYQIADIQVIPTLIEEAAGLVAIEGLLSGLPLIVTDSGGLVEYVDNNCALIVKRNNLTENLSNAMELLVLNENLRYEMSVAALKRGKIYRQEKYYKSFLACIDEIITETEKRKVLNVEK